MSFLHIAESLTESEARHSERPAWAYFPAVYTLHLLRLLACSFACHEGRGELHRVWASREPVKMVGYFAEGYRSRSPPIKTSNVHLLLLPGWLACRGDCRLPVHVLPPLRFAKVHSPLCRQYSSCFLYPCLSLALPCHQPGLPLPSCGVPLPPNARHRCGQHPGYPRTKKPPLSHKPLRR